MIGDIFAVFIFFLCGSIFLSLSLFYSKYKMNGRDANLPPYTTEFPYKNMFTDSDSQSWIYRFGRWMTDSMIFSFSNNRYFLDKIMDYSGNLVKTSVKDNGLLSLLALLIGPSSLSFGSFDRSIYYGSSSYGKLCIRMGFYPDRFTPQY
jgi:hypothetical protein